MQGEVYDFILGIPSETFYFSSDVQLDYYDTVDAYETFTIIKDSISSGYLVTADLLNADGGFGLPGDHVYTVLDAHEVRDLNGEIAY